MGFPTTETGLKEAGYIFDNRRKEKVMPETAEKPKTPRTRTRTRRNYAKEMDKLATYLDLIIRVKTSVRDELPADQLNAIAMAEGRLDAYVDVQNFMEGK